MKELLEKPRKIPGPQRYFTAAWLAFLTAGAATGLFFSVVDPEAAAACLDLPEISRTGAYTIGFFSFWLLTSLSAFLAIFFTADSGS